MGLYHVVESMWWTHWQLQLECYRVLFFNDTTTCSPWLRAMRSGGASNMRRVDDPSSSGLQRTNERFPPSQW